MSNKNASYSRQVTRIGPTQHERRVHTSFCLPQALSEVCAGPNVTDPVRNEIFCDFVGNQLRFNGAEATARNTNW